MKNESVNKIKKALGLKWEIIGVKFLPFKEDYQALAVPELNKKISVCFMAKNALDGKSFKAHGENVGCVYGGYAIGLVESNYHVDSGYNLPLSGLHESYAVGKNVMEGMKYLKHQMYGIQMGPLTEMEDADIVITLANAYQMMRIMQGYAYYYGQPQNLCTVGNQAMCSDLISKPFSNNDLNLSLMCKGARLFTKCGDGEMGVAMPIQLFDNVAKGTALTVNAVLEKKQKQKVLERLEHPLELGMEIDLDNTYSTKLRTYDAYANQCMEKKS